MIKILIFIKPEHPALECFQVIIVIPKIHAILVGKALLSPLSDMRLTPKAENYLLEVFSYSFFILVYAGQQAKPVLISISFICTLFNQARANSTL